MSLRGPSWGLPTPQLEPPDLLQFWPRHTLCSCTQGPPHTTPERPQAAPRADRKQSSQTCLRCKAVRECWPGRGSWRGSGWPGSQHISSPPDPRLGSRTAPRAGLLKHESALASLYSNVHSSYPTESEWKQQVAGPPSKCGPCTQWNMIQGWRGMNY